MQLKGHKKTGLDKGVIKPCVVSSCKHSFTSRKLYKKHLLTAHTPLVLVKRGIDVWHLKPFNHFMHDQIKTISSYLLRQGYIHVVKPIFKTQRSA